MADIDWYTVAVYAAQETTGPVIPVRIEIGPDPIPDNDPLPRNQRFAIQAERVVDALYAGLPGGTLDYVTAELLRRQARRIARHPDVAG